MVWGRAQARELKKEVGWVIESGSETVEARAKARVVTMVLVKAEAKDS